MLKALRDTIVFFIKWRLLSMKFWYAIGALGMAQTVSADRRL